MNKPDLDIAAQKFLSDLYIGGSWREGASRERFGVLNPPTVLSEVTETANCAHDEIFGPVAAIQTFFDTDDLIRRANDTEYGLVAYVFTEDMKRGHEGMPEFMETQYISASW